MAQSVTPVVIGQAAANGEMLDLVDFEYGSESVDNSPETETSMKSNTKLSNQLTEQPDFGSMVHVCKNDSLAWGEFSREPHTIVNLYWDGVSTTTLYLEETINLPFGWAWDQLSNTVELQTSGFTGPYGINPDVAEVLWADPPVDFVIEREQMASWPEREYTRAGWENPQGGRSYTSVWTLDFSSVYRQTFAPYIGMGGDSMGWSAVCPVGTNVPAPEAVVSLGWLTDSGELSEITVDPGTELTVRGEIKNNWPNFGRYTFQFSHSPEIATPDTVLYNGAPRIVDPRLIGSEWWLLMGVSERGQTHEVLFDIVAPAEPGIYHVSMGGELSNPNRQYATALLLIVTEQEPPVTPPGEEPIDPPGEEPVYPPTDETVIRVFLPMAFNP